MVTPPIPPQFSFVQQWMNLIGLLRYEIFFTALLVFLPLEQRADQG